METEGRKRKTESRGKQAEGNTGKTRRGQEAEIKKQYRGMIAMPRREVGEPREAYTNTQTCGRVLGHAETIKRPEMRAQEPRKQA